MQSSKRALMNVTLTSVGCLVLAFTSQSIHQNLINMFMALVGLDVTRIKIKVATFVNDRF
jgi:hypothetical protein